MRAAVLVLGTAEWDATIATNQHYASTALAKEFTLLFVESLGLRRPSLNRQDIGRIVRRLDRHRRKGHPVEARPRPSGLDVASPLVIPVHSRWSRPINGPLLRRAVRTWLQHDGPRLLWTYTPVTYGLEAHAHATIYHLVDLLHTYPGIDASAVIGNESRLRAAVHTAVASSPAVAQHLTASGFGRVVLLPNVAEIGPFISAAETHGRETQHPFAVFAGNITATKLDLSLIQAITDLSGGSLRVRLIGPLGLGGRVTPSWQRRLERTGAEIVAPMNLRDLAVECARASVALIPYEINDYTRGVNPLKTYEYLAAGLPVVSSPVPAMKPEADAIWVEKTAEAFAERVVEVGNYHDARVRKVRQDLARCNSWLERGEELRGLARQALGSG